MRAVTALTLLLALTTAQAAPVTWAISDLSFNYVECYDDIGEVRSCDFDPVDGFPASAATILEGGTVNGSFDYDADTNTFSNINVFTTNGSAGFHAINYQLDYYTPDGPLWDGDLGLATGDGYQNNIYSGNSVGLTLQLSSPMTNAGGVITVNAYEEDFVLGATRSSLGNAGTISAVPIPAAAWFFGSALAGLGWLRRKQAA